MKLQTTVFGMVLALLTACGGTTSTTAIEGQTGTRPNNAAVQTEQAAERTAEQSAPVPPANCSITPQDMEGPYYIANAPIREDIREGAPGDILILSGTVYLAGCAESLAGAVVDIWQADASGNYDFSDKFVLRGQAVTDDRGYYRFITVMPGYYGESGAVRPLHIHLKASHSNAKSVTSQIYFEGDQYASGIDPLLITPFSQTTDGFEMVFNIILDSQ